MKIILSRKGFDSSSGQQPNPILPDGTLLSLPIPSDEDSFNTFSSLQWKGMSYYEIIKSLNPKSKWMPNSHCHLDPDLRMDVRERSFGWKPAFGQVNAALTQLRNANVGLSDIFLFFGWFRQTEWIDGSLRYVRQAPNQHIIYGYMQIGDIIEKEDNIPEWLREHPHTSYKKTWNKGKNAIFLPTDKLSFDKKLPGCNILDFREDRVLTKKGCLKSHWNLPSFFKDVEITHHPNPWREDYFQSTGRGQEFIMKTTSQILEWTKNIIN